MSIKFDHVHKAFGPTKRILNGVSFEVKRGEILFVLGRSGVGKSVTLKHIVGVLKPDKGHVWVDDQDVTTLTELQMADVRRKCGMVFQHPALLDSLTVYENVSFGLRTPQYTLSLQRPLTEREIRKVVLEKLALVHLPASVLEKRPPEISYGMQKRVSLARTLAPGPDYLLFDEPTTGLDPITTNAVNELIFQLSRELKVTSLVVSHDMNCALKVADRILVLDGGNIYFLGNIPETVRSDKPLIKEFLAETLELLTPEERRKYGLEERA
jgi:phospholipid/cholesterol/gamma-HCH transport system ATP-binding protein